MSFLAEFYYGARGERVPPTGINARPPLLTSPTPTPMDGQCTVFILKAHLKFSPNSV